MDIDVYHPDQLETVFRVLRTALEPTQPLDVRERRFLDTYARITRYDLPRADPRPIDPRDVHIADPHQRKRLVQLCGIAALLARPVKIASVAFVRALSEHLATRDPVVDVIAALQKGQPFKARLLAMRRGMRALVKEAYQSEGLAGVLRFFGALLFKAPVNRDRLANYKRLGLLPEGTLGREYWKHMTEVGFNFPGEPAGIPDALAYHDIIHVLAQHETTPLGEIQQGSFQGGNRREDGFFFIQFVILQFHHGIRLTPATPATVDLFDPQLVLWAIHRGAQCKVDMTHQWNFWPLMSMTLAQARETCALLPKLPAFTPVQPIAQGMR
jgi:hypothetical protein